MAILARRSSSRRCRYLKKALRTSDSAFRIGGDEFALLLPQTDAEQALRLAAASKQSSLKCCSAAIDCRREYGPRRGHFPQDGEQAEQLIRVADERLYRLKHANHGKSENGGVERHPNPFGWNKLRVPTAQQLRLLPFRLNRANPERPSRSQSLSNRAISASEASKPSEVQTPNSYTIQRRLSAFPWRHECLRNARRTRHPARARTRSRLRGVAIELETKKPSGKLDGRPARPYSSAVRVSLKLYGLSAPHRATSESAARSFIGVHFRQKRAVSWPTEAFIVLREDC